MGIGLWALQKHGASLRNGIRSVARTAHSVCIKAVWGTVTSWEELPLPNSYHAALLHEYHKMCTVVIH